MRSYEYACRLSKSNPCKASYMYIICYFNDVTNVTHAHTSIIFHITDHPALSLSLYVPDGFRCVVLLFITVNMQQLNFNQSTHILI